MEGKGQEEVKLKKNKDRRRTRGKKDRSKGCKENRRQQGWRGDKDGKKSQGWKEAMKEVKMVRKQETKEESGRKERKERMEERTEGCKQGQQLMRGTKEKGRKYSNTKES